MGLSIRTTDIQMETDRTPSSLSIETQNARLELHQKHAKVNITTEKPKVLIDQYECFAEAGLKNNYDFTREAAQLGYQQAMDFIGQTAQDGGALAAIERGGNPIVAIAVRDASPEKSFVLAFIPQSRPKIDVTGNIDIQWDRNGEGIHNGVEGNYIPGYANINFEREKLNIYVKQYPSVAISYENSMDVSI
jgi:hypothetical protein